MLPVSRHVLPICTRRLLCSSGTILEQLPASPHSPHHPYDYVLATGPLLCLTSCLTASKPLPTGKPLPLSCHLHAWATPGPQQSHRKCSSFPSISSLYLPRPRSHTPDVRAPHTQVHYLLNIDCDVDELHIICTESLDSDWQSLLQDRFGLLGPRTSSPRAHKQGCAKQITARQKLACGNVHAGVQPNVAHGQNEHEVKRRNLSEQVLALTDEDEQIIRQCAYRQDTLLHRWMCGRGILENR
jgi:hypothetical protein